MTYFKTCEHYKQLKTVEYATADEDIYWRVHNGLVHKSDRTSYTHTHTLTECLLSSWALEWQEWAPHKAPERADDLNVLIHHDSPSQTHPNTPSTWLSIASFPLHWRNPAKGWPPKKIKIRIKRPRHAACSTHTHTYTSACNHIPVSNRLEPCWKVDANV